MSLVENINRRKRLGISRSKKKSTISPKAYKAMQNKWKKKQEITMPSHYGHKNKKMSAKKKKLAKAYGDPNKITRGDVIAMAKRKKNLGMKGA